MDDYDFRKIDKKMDKKMEEINESILIIIVYLLFVYNLE